MVKHGLVDPDELEGAMDDDDMAIQKAIMMSMGQDTNTNPPVAYTVPANALPTRRYSHSPPAPVYENEPSIQVCLCNVIYFVR